MAHKTLIDGTAYAVKGGRDLIAGTGYAKKQGKTLIDGTEHAISFGIPLNTITPGAILYLNESGSPVPFYIAKHDYESGLNGAGRTLVVRKELSRYYNFSESSNEYANSELDSWLCDTWLKLLGADIQTAIGTTRFYYTPGYRSSSITTLQRAAFQLSATELGGSTSSMNKEGSTLSIASTLRIAYRNGEALGQWTRTPTTNSSTSVCYFDNFGRFYVGSYNHMYGYRPAFTLPGMLRLAQNADGTYTLAA